MPKDSKSSNRTSRRRSSATPENTSRLGQLAQQFRKKIDDIRAKIGAFPHKTVYIFIFIVLFFFILPILWPYMKDHPFRPQTYGRIYVESPEVYTRERLVNDRYNQDYWLRRQLRKLDEATNLFSERRLDEVEAAVGQGLGTAEPAAVVPATEASFATGYEIRAAMRDRIRQMILENLLDDRHDLTGNSVFGLKFDTAVIPGDNTRARPFVKVRLSLDQFPELDEFPTFFAYSEAEIKEDNNNIFHRVPDHFEAWKNSIQARINKYISNSLHKNEIDECWHLFIEENRGDFFAQKMSQRINDLILNAISNVLSVERQDITAPNRIEFRRDDTANYAAASYFLPPPWDKYFYLNSPAQKEDQICSDPPKIKVENITSSYIIFREKEWNKLNKAFFFREGDPSKKQVQYSYHIEVDRIGNLEKFDDLMGKGLATDGVVVTSNTYSPSDTDVLQKLPAIYDKEPPDWFGSDDLRHLLSNSETAIVCVNPIHKDGPGALIAGYFISNLEPQRDRCPEGAMTAKRIVVQWGLANFVRSLSKFDAYAYAAFPRQDVTGILSRRLRSAAIQTVEGSGLSAGVRTTTQAEAAKAVPTLVGFADGRSIYLKDGEETDPEHGNKIAVDFGWIIASSELVDPVQKSQLVLVSVPGYLNALDLTVTTGWLDGNLREFNLSQSRPATIRLPPDFEVFDTLAGQASLRYGPAIFDDHIDKGIRVRACSNAEIVIPGSRLWRSTTVTLGGQPADKIAVLPNMQGIIATFLPVHPPSVFEPRQTGERVSPLIVWTSEGVDILIEDVSVEMPDSGTCADGEDTATSTVPVLAGDPGQ